MFQLSTVNPAIAGIVDLDTPPAIAFASPPQLLQVNENFHHSSNCPKKTKRGATPTHNLIKGRFALILELVFEINIPLIALEFHEDLSGPFHLSTASLNSLLQIK